MKREVASDLKPNRMNHPDLLIRSSCLMLAASALFAASCTRTQEAAFIGGAMGTAMGTAIADRDPVAGAVVGGMLGAAAGAIIADDDHDDRPPPYGYQGPGRHGHGGYGYPDHRGRGHRSPPPPRYGYGGY